MKIQYVKTLTEYYRLEKELNNIYKNYAASHGVPESKFQVLYAIYVEPTQMTQTDICTMWAVPLQTINSSLKQMEAEGIIELVGDDNNRRKKYVKLTADGERTAEKLVGPIVKAENESFAALSNDEQTQLLSLRQKQLQAFIAAIEESKK